MFGTFAGSVDALGADKAANLHGRAAGCLTAAAAGRLFIATELGARCCHAVAVAGTGASRSPPLNSLARLLSRPLRDSPRRQWRGGRKRAWGLFPRVYLAGKSSCLRHP